MQLRPTEQKLKKSNRDLEKFAYVTSHDLRAPLRGIQNLIGWIEEDSLENLSEESKDYFNKIKVCVRRMDLLINGVLEYLKINDHHDTDQITDLNCALAEVVDLLNPPDYIQVDINGDFPKLTIPRVQINKIF